LTLLAFIGHSVAIRTTDDYLLDRDPRRRTSTRTTHFVSVPSSTATCRALEGPWFTPRLSPALPSISAGVWPACVAYLPAWYRYLPA